MERYFPEHPRSRVVNFLKNMDIRHKVITRAEKADTIHIPLRPNASSLSRLGNMYGVSPGTEHSDLLRHIVSTMRLPDTHRVNIVPVTRQVEDFGPKHGKIPVTVAYELRFVPRKR